MRKVQLTMDVEECCRINELAGIGGEWGRLLDETEGAGFFQSLTWLEVYWRHFGAGQKLRILAVRSQGNLAGILPLTVRTEHSKVGRLRVLTFPLHDWGSFYGPIGPDPYNTLVAGLEHLRLTPRDWDVLEPRWLGGPGTDPMVVGRAMRDVGLHAYATTWDHTHVVDVRGTWESYWSARKGDWLRKFRHAERRLSQQGKIGYVRYRPHGSAHGDGDPRWDLYDACEQIAQRSWQGAATDGTTLSHVSIRSFLRDAHQAAAATGAVDLNLLLVDGRPAAFVYGYHRAGYVYGLRRGYDAELCREGAGNILLAYTLRDSFARGDRMYDMGVGSPASKRHFQTRTPPILRYSHFPALSLRGQLVRARRWWQSRRPINSLA